VIYKTAYYSFYLPVACALYMLNVPESYTTSGVTQKPYEISKSILLPLGEYFQIQDDFLDYSAPPEQLGKIGTDIIDNKCSWVINTALLLCSKPSTPGGAEMRKVLDENYGRKDAQCEARVKKVYERLNITKVYGEYEERVVGELKAKIGGIVETEGGLKREVFESFLGKIYKRSK
jgi:farnesyl diphosphate synthase